MFIVGKMVAGHVYSDPTWLSGERLIEKRQVMDAPGARFASAAFCDCPKNGEVACSISLVALQRSSVRKWPIISTAHAKGARRRLDLNLTLVLGARTEPECAARGLNSNGAGTFVWIIHKLVELDL